MVSCHTVADLNQLEKDLADAFGPMPDEVRRLLTLAEIRVHARRFGVASISLRPPDVVFAVRNMSDAEPLFIDAPGTVRMPDANTVHLRLPPKYLETATLLPVLRQMLVRTVPSAEVAS